MRNLILRKTVAALATLATVAGVLLFAAGTASAAMRCTAADENNFVFSTAGIYTDVHIKLCAATEEDEDGNLEVIARAYVSWTGPILPIVDRFEKFEFNLRLEYKDVNKSGWHPCYPVLGMNQEREGSHYCDTYPFLPYTGGAYWTADATVRVNINNDGQGDELYELQGSPRV